MRHALQREEQDRRKKDVKKTRCSACSTIVSQKKKEDRRCSWDFEWWRLANQFATNISPDRPYKLVRHYILCNKLSYVTLQLNCSTELCGLRVSFYLHLFYVSIHYVQIAHLSCSRDCIAKKLSGHHFQCCSLFDHSTLCPTLIRDVYDMLRVVPLVHFLNSIWKRLRPFKKCLKIKYLEIRTRWNSIHHIFILIHQCILIYARDH